MDDDEHELAIDNFILIREVHKRPILYDKALQGYSNLTLKRRAWLEVCEKVADDWANWSKVLRQKSLADVQKRWHNLRTCFLRELRYQKSKSSKSRRKYVYYKALSFLKAHTYLTKKPESLQSEPVIESPQSEPSITTVKTESLIGENPDEENGDIYVDELNEEDELLPRIENQEHTRDKRHKTIEVMLQDHDSFHHKSVTEGQSINQDVNFAMSLVPMLKNLPLTKKLEVQIEILKIFKHVIDSN